MANPAIYGPANGSAPAIGSALANAVQKGTGAIQTYGSQSSPSGFQVQPVDPSKWTGGIWSNDPTDLYGLNALATQAGAYAGQAAGRAVPMATAAQLPTAPLYHAPLGTAATGTAAQGTGSFMGAATGNSALAGPTQVGTAGDLPFAMQQQQLADILGRQAAGGGMSPADIQLQQGRDANVAAQLAVLGSQRGNTGNAALAMRSAADQGALASAQLNSAMGLQRANETLAAQGALGNVLGTARGQGQAYNALQANLNQGTNLANLGATNQFGLANLGALNAANQFNAGNAQASMLANLGAANQYGLANLGATNQMTLANLGNIQQQNLANQQFQGNFALQNAAYQQQTDLANQASQLQAMGLNDQQIQAMLGLQGNIEQGNRTAVQNWYTQLINQREAAAGITNQANALNMQQNQNMWNNALGVAGAGLSALGGLAALSDQNLKAGIQGANPMLDSYLRQMSESQPADDLDSIRKTASLWSTPAPPTPAMGGSSLMGGMEGLLKGVKMGRDRAQADAIQQDRTTNQAAGAAANEAADLASQQAAQENDVGDPFLTSSDDREKQAVMSGSRGIQSFLQQANMQTNAQNQQGAYNTGFTQTGTVPSAQADRQLPGWMGGNPAAGYGSGNFGDIYGGGATQPGGFTQGEVMGGPGMMPGGVSSPGGFYSGLTQPNAPFAQLTPGGALTENHLGNMGYLTPASQGYGQTSWSPSYQQSWTPASSGLPGMSVAAPTLGGPPVMYATPRVSSDERAKEDKRDVGDMLDKLHAYSYRYKDPESAGAAPGRHTGVMAQDLERSPLGAEFVRDTPGGKMVDYGQMAGTQLAATAYLNERLNRHEALLRQLTRA